MGVAPLVKMGLAPLCRKRLRVRHERGECRLAGCDDYHQCRLACVPRYV